MSLGHWATKRRRRGKCLEGADVRRGRGAVDEIEVGHNGASVSVDRDIITLENALFVVSVAPAGQSINR